MGYIPAEQTVQIIEAVQAQRDWNPVIVAVIAGFFTIIASFFTYKRIKK